MGPEPPQALPVRRINGLDGPRGHVVLRLVNRLRLAIRPAPPISLFFVVRLVPESMAKMRKRRRSPVTRVVSTTATR